MKNNCIKLTASMTLPVVQNCSPAMSISTVVSAPTAGWETEAKKWRTTSSYNFCNNESYVSVANNYHVRIYIL